MPPSILNLFLSGDRVPGACSGSVAGWPGIAVPPGSAHFPTKLQIVMSSSQSKAPLLVMCCVQVVLLGLGHLSDVTKRS